MAARKAIVRALLTGRAAGSLAVELLPVDRILQRWAVSVMGGMPIDVWDDTPAARPPPLDEECAYLMDRIILKLPHERNRIVNLWYRKPVPTREIARMLNCSSSGLYLKLNATLWTVRDRILDGDNSTLIEMVNMRDLEVQ